MNTKLELLWELTQPANEKLGVLLQVEKFTGKNIQPKVDEEGSYFDLEQLYSILECDCISIVNVPNSELILVCDEEGLFKQGATFNLMASTLAETPLVGNVLLCHTSLVR